MGPLSKPDVEICGRGQDVIMALMMKLSRFDSMVQISFHELPFFSALPPVPAAQSGLYNGFRAFWRLLLDFWRLLLLFVTPLPPP